ncbi:MAG: hypothetical protein ABIK89_21450, partial [Planctomycetota bacterium]
MERRRTVGGVVLVPKRELGNEIELRLAPPEPLDLSEVEAVEVRLKAVRGARLTPRDVFLCDPVSGEFVFQVCDYLTRQPLGERRTAFALQPAGRRPAIGSNPAMDGRRAAREKRGEVDESGVAAAEGGF